MSTEDTMSGETTGAQDVPERPASEEPDEPAADDPPRERDDRGTIGSVTAEPGDRRTANVEKLKTEARMVADGHEPDNPWLPVPDSGVVAEFVEWAEEEDEDYQAAWLKPWEEDGGGE